MSEPGEPARSPSSAAAAHSRSRSRAPRAAAGRTPFLVGIVGAADPAIEAFAHVWVRIGEVGKLFSTLRADAASPTSR